MNLERLKSLNNQGKNLKCFLGRASLVGDTIMFLSSLTYFKKLYPDSYTIFPIARKCSQAAMLYIGHPEIDKIHILENWESLGENDIKLVNSCDIKINPFPSHPPCPGYIVGIDNFWYNHYNCVTETARMAGIDEGAFNTLLSEEERKPHLYQWFELNKEPKSIAIHARAGYNKEQTRNPSTQYWKGLTATLIKEGYKVYHCGVESEEDIGEGVIRITNLSLFDQIKIALSTDCLIGNDSGFSWIYGAYGHNMISLINIQSPGHITNELAFAPENYKENSINLITRENYVNISYETIIDSINQLK